VARPERGRLRSIGLGIASLLLAGLAAEGVLRAVNPSVRQPFQVQAVQESERAKFSSHHPLLGWIGTPGAEDDFSYVDCRHHVRQNAHGFRGTEYPFVRDGDRRVVVLGDSFVWGFGVEGEEIFTSVVERESQGRLEILNQPVPARRPDQTGPEAVDPLQRSAHQLASRSDPFLYFPWNKHWSAAAHRLGAELVHESLAFG
jgi:hypothetical protein